MVYCYKRFKEDPHKQFRIYIMIFHKGYNKKVEGRIPEVPGFLRKLPLLLNNYFLKFVATWSPISNIIFATYIQIHQKTKKKS